MLGPFTGRNAYIHRTATIQISPRVTLFVIWMLGWAVGLLMFNALAGDSPVLLAYMLVMLTSGVWTVSLSLLPHLPRIPKSQRTMPKPQNVIDMQDMMRRNHPEPEDALSDHC